MNLFSSQKNIRNLFKKSIKHKNVNGFNYPSIIYIYTHFVIVLNYIHYKIKKL